MKKIVEGVPPPMPVDSVTSRLLGGGKKIEEQQQAWLRGNEQQGRARIELNQAERALQSGDIESYTRHVAQAESMSVSASESFVAAAGQNLAMLDKQWTQVKVAQQVTFAVGDVVSEFGGPAGKAVWKAGKGLAETIEGSSEHGMAGSALRVVGKELVKTGLNSSLEAILGPLPDLRGRPFEDAGTLLRQPASRWVHAAGRAAISNLEGTAAKKTLQAIEAGAR